MCDESSAIPWPWCSHFEEFYIPKYNKTPAPFSKKIGDRDIYRDALYKRDNYNHKYYNVSLKGKTLKTNAKAYLHEIGFAPNEILVPDTNENVIEQTGQKDDKLIGQRHDDIPSILQDDQTKEKLYDAFEE